MTFECDDSSFISRFNTDVNIQYGGVFDVEFYNKIIINY